MTAAVPAVALGDVLEPVSRAESVRAAGTYDLLGAHWYARGLYTKDSKLGTAIQAKTLYRVEAGDFVYNRLFAWKGSFALADEVNHGCHVSNEFLCYRVAARRVDPQYLLLYFSRPSAWTEALGLSTGSTPTSRNRLKEERFLAMQMPLPPVGLQRTIACRVRAVLGKL
ncbi:MAG: hypothetical protein ACR2PL_25160, partial [Dehalococcoidia bacterium]